MALIEVQYKDLWNDGGHPVIRGVSFSVGKGDRIAIVGPNGCGKTTLLRSIAGLSERNAKPNFPPNQRVSFLPTRPLDLLLPWKSVADNYKLFSELAGEKNTYRADTLLKMLPLDMEEHSHKLVHELSSGQQAMVALVCSLIQTPDLLIADECLSTLATQATEQATNLIKQCTTTVIFASHDRSITDALATRRLYVRGMALEPI